MRFLTVLALLVACSNPGSDEPTKDEAREVGGGADLGLDYCEDFGWYGDGICDDFCPRTDVDDCGVESIDGEGPTLCVGLRGNGTHIPGHFGSMARIFETYGLVDGVAGGSSGSISSFFIESIEMNPYVQCDECSAHQAGLRAALLVKSIDQYFAVLAMTDEATSIQSLAAVAGAVQAAGIESLLESDPTSAIAELQTVLQSDELRAFINPEVLELLSTSPDPAYHARDIVETLMSFGSFAADDPLILVRPGVISFEVVADRVGRIGSFLAGYDPVDSARMERFLSECSEDAVGRRWAEIAGDSLGDTTCGELLNGMIVDYRDAREAGSFASRVDDMVGGVLPAYISTSVLERDAVDAWRAARDQYLAAQEVTLDVDFADVRFGYWGSDEDLTLLDANARAFSDDKTDRARLLGEATWREVLSFSPAEPGLARALQLPRSTVVGPQVSAGGWSDLAPTLALKNLGCQKVIYVTRRGPESNFARGVAMLLGMSASDDAALYDLGNAQSGYAISVEEADAVWCTDWNVLPASDPAAIWNDGYDAEVESLDPLFLEGSYTNVRTALGQPGCTPGVTP